jgi:uncharacterized protein
VISDYLLAPTIAFVAAQVLKYLVQVLKTRRFTSISELYMPGNMPSAHSATMVALTTVIGLKDGADSAIFAVSLVIMCIVIYDAMQVRRAVGEQGRAIKALLAKVKLTNKPYQANGHTPPEVAIGGLLGIASALIALTF